MKKSTFKVIAEAIAFDKFDKAKFALKELKKRKATIDEIKQYIIEAAKKAKENVKAKKEMGLFGDEVEGGWGDADLMKHLDFIKSLDIKEFFKRGK